MLRYKTLQIISGSDSSGGAGMQADIKTATSLGVYSLSALTALTAQNTCGVSEILDIDEKFVKAPLDTNYEEIKCDAVKIGMLHKKSLIKEIKDFLLKNKIQNIVLDPVMVSTSGAVLLEKDAILSLKNDLFPLADIITPNLHEARLLFEKDINTKEDAQNACLYLGTFGCKYVLIKALEYEEGFSIDCLYSVETKEFTYLKNKKIDTLNTHGTGCSLSSAIASYLALGFKIEEACQKANTYVNEAITSGSKYKIGKNTGPINHMYKIMKD